MADYRARIVDAELGRALEEAGAVVLRGARAVGKTETARQVAASELRLDSTDPLAALARQQPSTALSGDVPRLLDEWQLVPGLWNEVRHAVDDRRQPGQFVLSGSAVPTDELRHPGAGRFRQLALRTMTFTETGHSSGAVSLGALLSGTSVEPVETTTSFEDVVHRLVVGGWPGWFEASESASRAQLRSYIEDISEHEFVQVAGRRRDPRRLTAMLLAVAALIAQPASYTTMFSRIRSEGTTSIRENSVSELYDLATRLFLVEDQPAWAPKLRSRTSALQTPKRHLVDPSLAAALLGAGPDRLLSEPETLGFCFESQVVHDLRVYAQALGARGVFHYRDTKGRDEIDAVVEGQDGSWIAIEVKLGTAAIDRAAENLQRVVAKIERPPEASIIIIPTGVAYRRTDGVLVVPLTALGP